MLQAGQGGCSLEGCWTASQQGSCSPSQDVECVVNQQEAMRRTCPPLSCVKSVPTSYFISQLIICTFGPACSRSKLCQHVVVNNVCWLVLVFFLQGCFLFSPLCKMVKRGILPTYDWSFCTCFLWLPELFSICFLTSLSTGLNQLPDCGTLHDAV